MNKIYLLIVILLSVTGIVSEPITGIITGGFGTANIDEVINLNNTNFTITFDILDETDLRAPGDSISEGFKL